MKKLFGAVLAIFIAAAPLSARCGGNGDFAAAAETELQPGDSFEEGDLEYTVLGSGTLNVACPADNTDTLTQADIPDEVWDMSVTVIGYRAFANCKSLSSVTVPKSVISISSNSFEDCPVLTAINVDEENTAYSSEDGIVFNKNGTTLVKYPEGKPETSYTVPDSVTRIGTEAFSRNKALTEVTIPDSVTNIGMNSFDSCEGLTSMKIPDNVTNIGHSAFYCCKNMTYVIIPDSVKSIGYFAFVGTGITDVYYSGTEEDWNDISISSQNDDLTNAHFHFESDGPEEEPEEEPVPAPAAVVIPLPETGAPEIADLKAETTVDGDAVTVAINEDGTLDVGDIPDDVYTFVFSASFCAAREYEVTVLNGEALVLGGSVELHLLGDINGDGYVNTQDVARANAHVKNTALLEGYELACINVNSDEFINVQDVALMNAHAKNTKMLW